MSSPDEQTPPEANALTEPKTGFWGKVFSMTPVVMTLIATALAGISSSELTQSMYWRSLAAQNQSKAGDQWSFFQVKRVRGTTLESTADLIGLMGATEPLTVEELTSLAENLKPAGPLGPERFRKACKQLDDFLNAEKTKESLERAFGGTLAKPVIRRLKYDDPKQQAEAEENEKRIEEVRRLIEQRKTEGDTADEVARIKPEFLERATAVAEEDADTYDKANQPAVDSLKALKLVGGELARSLAGRKFDEAVKATVDRINAGAKLASNDFNSRRYAEEAKLNLRVAQLYEVRVRRSGVESDRHRKRSTLFFFSMIGAQAGVVVASLAMSRSRKSLFWLVAVLAGLGSLGFAGWVYVTVV